MDGVRVRPDEVAAFVGHARTALPDMRPAHDDAPAFFELTLALALDHFRRSRVQWAVLEAGVGGASDATAAVSNSVRLVVLTNVDLDHAETIGPALADIAREKAGAFARGVPAVTAATGVGLEVARAVADQRGVTLTEVAPLAPGETTRAANERLAAAALDLLGVPAPAIARARKTAPLPGRGERFEVGGRRVLLDGAHDPAAAKRLAEQIEGPYVLVFGSLTRKQGARTLSELEAGATAVIVTEASQGDGAAHLSGPGREVVEHPSAALKEALGLTPPGGQVVVAGSLYLAGALRPLLNSLTHVSPPQTQ